MQLGYNTNGFAHHDVFDAVEILADIGYRSIALTLDHGALNPFDPHCEEQVQRMGTLLRQRGLRSVVETGARYLLDPRAKHEPTLVTRDDAGRERRIEFLCRAVDIASRLQSDCVSIWSGVLRDECGDAEAFTRLAASLEPVLRHAAERNVKIGFEPEPGMLVATMGDFERLLSVIDAPNLGLTLDVGHLHCLGEGPIADVIRRWQRKLVNVHIEDMVRGTHDHRMFGEGEMDFEPILLSLDKTGYSGGVHVELSRHSHDAPAAESRAYHFLRGYFDAPQT